MLSFGGDGEVEASRWEKSLNFILAGGGNISKELELVLDFERCSELGGGEKGAGHNQWERWRAPVLSNSEPKSASLWLLLVVPG